MGQTLSAPDLSNYATKDEVLKQIKETTIESEEKFAKKTELDNTYINKINDKAVYSEETNNDDTKYITPLYWGQRYNANRSSTNEKDDNETKYVTPKFVSDRKTTWTVSASNDASLSNTSDDKFVTPAWTNAKINQQKSSWTVSASNDVSLTNTSDDKFATPTWINSKINQQKTTWTVSAANDSNLTNVSDDKFATPAWINSKMIQQKIESTVSAANDPKVENVDDSKFVTPQWVNQKIQSLKPTSSARDTRSDDMFVTPRYLTDERTATNASHEESSFHFATPKYLNDVWLPGKKADLRTDDGNTDKYTTPSYVNQKIAAYMTLNPVQISSTSENTIAQTLSRNAAFTAGIANRLKDDQNVHSGIANTLTDPLNAGFNRNNAEFLATKVTDNLLANSTERYLLVGQLADKLAVDYKAELTQDIGENANFFNIRQRLKFGDSVTQSQSPFQTTQETNTNVITSGKFGSRDAEIQLVNAPTSNDLEKDAKDSHLEIRGAAKAYQVFGSTRTTRGKRRVKIFDDVMIDNKLAIGPNEDVDDDFQLNVSGPAKFKQGIHITEGTSNLGGVVNISGNTKITGKVGIATDADSNFDLKVGGPANFTNTVKMDGETTITGNTNINGNLNVQNLVANNVTVNEPSTFNKDVIIRGKSTLNGETNVLGNLVANNVTVNEAAVFNKNVTVNGEVNAQRSNVTEFTGDQATFNKNVTIKGDINAQKTTVTDLTTNSITAGGPATFTKDVSVTGKATITGDTQISGNTQVTGITATSGNGYMVNIHKNGRGNNDAAMLVRQNGDNSWGLVSEFRTEGPGSDRPSILFSSDKSDQSWSVGFGGSDNNFRIRQNHGKISQNWGTERMRINTDGTVNLLGAVNVSGGGTGEIQNPNGVTKISSHGIMFGGANNGRESNSAQISAGIHEANSLNIVGMSSGTGPEDRKVSMWAEGGFNVRGDITSSKNINATEQVRTQTVVGTSTNGRLHLGSEESIYMLPKNGVIIGREWGGNGNLTVQGTVTTNSVNTNVTTTDSMIVKGGNPEDISGPNGTLKMNQHGIMFGGPNNGKENNSAQISAGMHEANSLNIVGMSSGTGAQDRRVRVWAEGGFIVNGRNILAELDALNSNTVKYNDNVAIRALADGRRDHWLSNDNGNANIWSAERGQNQSRWYISK